MFAAFAVALLVAYGPALSGGLLWDDPDQIPAPELRNAGGLVRMWFEFGVLKQYYPITYSLLGLQAVWWGLTPDGQGTTGLHVVNVLVHALGSTLVFVLLRGLAVPGALLGAALFAFHPVQVESVAWISELKNTLSGVFYFGALLAYLRFALPQDGRAAERRRWSYAIALVLFTSALLSKTVVATLPGAILVILWWQRGRLEWRRDVLPLLPMLALAVGFGILSAWMEKFVVGAEGERFHALQPAERFVLAGRALAFYAGKLAWPADLVFSYPRWTLDADRLVSWLPTIGVVVAIAAAWALRGRLGRGPLAGALFFCGTLFPALGFVDVFPFRYSYVADHFQYLACLGLLVPFAAAAALLAARAPWLTPRGRLGSAAVLVGLLAFLSWRQAHVYRDIDTLWRVTLERNPASWMAHSNMAIELGKQGRHAEAIERYEAALAIDPTLYEARFNMGNAYKAMGRLDDAIAAYRSALDHAPEAYEVYNNLAIALEDSGDVSAAVENYRRALAIEPRFAIAECNLGRTLARAGQLDEAVAYLRSAIEHAPRYASAHMNLGIALGRQGQNAEAIAFLRRAVRLDPRNAETHHNLGAALLQAGEPEAAARSFQNALQLRPDYPKAREGLQQARERRR